MKNKKPTLFGALKYLAIALPFLFIAPIVVTMGFKALRRDDSYMLLILGIVLLLSAIIITAIGLVRVSRYLFDKGNDKK